MPNFALVRHGPTTFNDVGRLRGWMNPPLTEAGIAQAAAIHNHPALQGKPIYSSDLLRAQQTAMQLGSIFVATPALRPWNVGVFAGLPTEQVHPILMEYVASNRRVPFGEKWSEFTERLTNFVYGLQHDAVLVTHYRCCYVLLGREVETGDVIEL